MPIVNNIITAGPRLSADIATALGVSNTNLSYLCGNSHGKINPWCKFKPVPFKMAFPRSGNNGETLQKNSSGYVYWQGESGYCGFLPQSFRTENDAKSNCNGTINGWRYTPPTGGADSPNRMGDFIGYDRSLSTTHGIGSVHISGTKVF